jgi:hypothetical protein
LQFPYEYFLLVFPPFGGYYCKLCAVWAVVESF